jgi:hypothetical protein
MSQDLLAPYRIKASTAPTPADTPAAEEKHRSVADGELARPWTLTEYFRSLNTVMRLPTKARRTQQAEAAARGIGGISIPSVNPAFSRALLVLGAVVVLGVVVVRPIFLWASGSGREKLAPVVGVWEAGAGRWAGRSFEVSDSSIAFRNGEQRTDYSWHRIHDVRVRPAADSALYTVIYEESGKTAELTFWFKGGSAPAIRLKNTPAVVWSKSGRAATAQPRS